MKKIVVVSALLAALTLTGCASVPLASNSESVKAKSFPVPSEGHSGLYVYRDSFAGKALKKDVYLDGKCVERLRIKYFSISKSSQGSHTC